MAFVIPSIFTAVDRFSGPLGIMGRATQSFNDRVGMATTKLLAFGEAAALIGGVGFLGKSVMDYESELHNLKALTGVSGDEFVKFKDTIEDVAHSTRRSSVEVAGAFTTIANAMPELLDSAVGLGKVTDASITLAKAARMELTPAAESLTTILNQFGQSADYAAKAVDMMAAGSKYGSAEINDLSASITEFGAQAKLAGVSLQESIGLTELVSKFRKGSQAGTELRNVLLYMDTLKVQDPKALADLNRLGVNMSLVANKAIPLADRFKELSKIGHDDAAMFHVFGKENLAMAANILTNVDALKPLVDNIGEVGNAQRMAGENSSTLSNRLIELKNVLVTSVTSSKGAELGLAAFTGVVVFLTDHMDGIVLLAESFLAVWSAVKLVTAATWAFNFAEGAAAVLTGRLNNLFVVNAASARGAAAAIWLMEAPLVTILGPVLLVGTALGLLNSIMDSTYNTTTELNGQFQETRDGFRQIKPPITEATYALEQYNKAVDDYNSKAAANRRLQLHAAFNEKMGRTDTWGDFFAQIPDAIRAGNGIIGDAPNVENYLTQNQIEEVKNSGKETKHVIELVAPAGYTAKEISGSGNSNLVVTTKTGGAW
jgi:TP901 family phage tail tape measure protein